jgi:hypothetical protein
MPQPSTVFAPDPVMRAALDILGHACVFVRNATLSPDASIKMINDLMEAIHDIPFQLQTWDDSRLDLLRLHLRCFDSTLYPCAPNFLNRFEMLLASYNEEKAEQDVHGNTH